MNVAGEPDAPCDGASPTARGQLADALAANQRWLRTVLVARGVEASSLDDVLQHVASEAIARVDELRDWRSMAPWLYRIAVVAALAHRRRHGRQRKLAERYAACGLAPDEAVEADPLDWLISEEQTRLVRLALSTLPRRDAEILLLKYTENWSYRELAERLGMTTVAIDGRLRRARERLRHELAKLSPSLVTFDS